MNATCKSSKRGEFCQTPTDFDRSKDILWEAYSKRGEAIETDEKTEVEKLEVFGEIDEIEEVMSHITHDGPQAV